MSIPNLPPFSVMQWVDKKANLSTDAFLYMDEQAQTLNETISVNNELISSEVVTDPQNESKTRRVNGVKVPLKTTAEITNLEPDAAIGSLWFNTTVGKLNVKTASGTVRTVAFE